MEASVVFCVGVAACSAGVVAGVVGTVASVRAAHGARERHFAVVSAALVWAMAVVTGCLLLVLDPFMRWYAWVSFAFVLPVAVIYWNQRQLQIRRDEREHGPIHRVSR
jgi:uncharacterized membrane protein YphA (DoxX/SURF4 family)